ncbi:NgoPII family restriction endonuclease, partial [Tumidithrix elongata RA019]|nr:NgoPII family restriction endonuclease [Tumidithrix elongata RA019]
MANLLQAISNIIHSPILDVVSYYRGRNRINAVGDALEAFIKDAFANTLNSDAENTNTYSQVFSYIGNANNPPDLILKDSDAIEVKKIESLKSQIALNSSYPKSRLLSNDPMITNACRNCEDIRWTEKDIIYTIGVIRENKLKLIWFIYGDCQGYFILNNVLSVLRLKPA